ncbi:hypothetical protein RHGRI_029274 [Rhododendron griersonianum]|uniref:Gibberellin regulated protein n=1 Tax=Rhododendron griersonianum TaxID=479676 RepID=A0AAV6IIN3_9ERIC|nr:hypothetical protein RHGRI_029274 [Rhododendron griersonianum]
MKPVSATLLIVSLVLTSSLLRTTAAQADTSYPCDSKCQDRCALAGEKKRCLDYCGICCQICKCVPPGYMLRVTLGNLTDLVSAVAKCLYKLQEHETHAPEPSKLGRPDDRCLRPRATITSESNPYA